MTTLSLMSIINNNGINYKVVFEKTKCHKLSIWNALVRKQLVTLTVIL